MRRLFLIVIMLTLAAGNRLPATAADGPVRATVDRTQIDRSESVQLSITASGGEASVDLAPLSDFKVISRGTSTSIQIVNGRTSRETTTNYSLFPLKEGVLTIPSLTVAVGGETQRTRPIAITVARPNPGENAGRDIFVRAEVSNPSPWVGEPITYFVRLYCAARIADPSVEQVPNFDGFSAKALNNREAYRKVISGREYIVRELAFVLTPLSGGQKTLAPAIVSLDVYTSRQQQPRRGLNRLFDDPFFGGGNRETRRLRTDPVTVRVRPLPPDSPGAFPFTGLVGRFQLTASLEKDRFAVGDAATLTVTLSGKGNLVDAEPPEMALPEGLKMYADAPEEQIEFSPEGYTGSKTFRLALVGVSPGTYPIGPFNLRYFNLDRSRYETLSAAAGPVTVTSAGAGDTFKVATAQGPAAAAASTKQAVEFTGRDILPIKDDLDALRPHRQMGLRLFCLLLLAPALVCLCAWGFRALRRPTQDPGILMAKRSAEELRAAERSGETPFFSHLSRALVFAILSRAGIRGESLTREAEETLVSTGMDPQVAFRAAGLLERIDSSRYGHANLEAAARRELTADTRAMIKEVTHP